MKQLFRIPQQIIDNTLLDIGGQLSYPTNRNHCLSAEQQLKLTLRFMASNGFYTLVGDAHGVHQLTVCRAVKRTTNLLVEKYFDSLFKWPRNLNERLEIAQEFITNGGFPSVSGAIDGSNIAIFRPNDNEILYVNRHHFYSLNVLTVSTPDHYF